MATMLSETQSLGSEFEVVRDTPRPWANASRSGPIHRRGESKFMRLFFRAWAPMTHCTICVILATYLLVVLDGARLKSEKRKSHMDVFWGDNSLRVSDVTTMVSAALVILRTVGQSFMLGMAWRAAMVLLQHDGLNLSQLNTMISYRIPTSLSGKHTWSVAIVLLMLLPSTFISPLLSGSVDWVQGNTPDGSVTANLPAGFGLRRFLGGDWEHLSSPQNKLAVLGAALGHAGQAWTGVKSNKTNWGQHRYVAVQDAPVSTIVEDVPMPFIDIHEISWDRESEVEGWVWHKTQDPGSNSRAGLPFFFGVGNAIFFKTRNDAYPNPYRGRARVIRDTWHLAVMVARSFDFDPREKNCVAATIERWDGTYTEFPLVTNGTWCWALATVSFTVGIRYFERGVYVGNRTVEALPDSKSPPKIVGDTWAKMGLYLLSDMLAMLPLMKTEDEEYGTRNLTQYVEILIRQSYLSMRGALRPYRPEATNLTAYYPISYLEAQVDSRRVCIWLALNLLLPISALGMLWVENGHEGSGRRRDPVVHTALAPLLTDVRDVLVEDPNGISNMSYLTNYDTKALGKLRLTSVDIPGSGSVFAVTKKRIPTSTYYVKDLGYAEARQHTEEERTGFVKGY